MPIKGRNLATDAVKGLMIILIILHHSQLLPFLHHGYLGVDVFFMIAGYYLMQHFSYKKGSATQYSIQRIKVVYLPYLLALLLACLLDYKRLTSFQGFDGLVQTYAPFASFLTLTEELGFVYHTPVILVGGWFLSVLIIDGFLIYGMLDYSERLTIKILLPFSIILGFTYLFSKETRVESFSIIGALSFPLLRGYLEIGTGVLLYSFIQNQIVNLQRKTVLVNFVSITALLLFCIMVVSESSLDCLLIISIPSLLLGVMTPVSFLQKISCCYPFKLLAIFGSCSLEAYLIHQPILHIVHSCWTHFGLAVRPVLLIPIDLAAVITATILLHYVCGRIRNTINKRAVTTS